MVATVLGPWKGRHLFAYVLEGRREWGIHHLQPAPSVPGVSMIQLGMQRISSSSEGAVAADNWELGTGTAMLRSEGQG